MFKNFWANKVIKNLSYFAIWKGVNKLLFFVLIIFISRILGVESLGIYGFIFAFISLVFPLSNIGQQVFMRDLITNRKFLRKFWGNFLVLKLLTSFILYAFIIAITLTFPVPKELKPLIYLTGFILFWNVFSETASAIFISHQKIKPVVLANIISDLIIVSLATLFILSDKGIVWVMIAFVIGELVKAIILNFLLIKKFSMPEFKVDVKICLKWVKKGFYFIMQSQLKKGLFRTDTLVIFLVSGLYATGIYQAAYKMAIQFDIIPLLFGMIFYPEYINANRISFENLKIHYAKYKTYIGIVSAILCLALFIFSKHIVLLVYGREFTESVLILKILAVSALFIGLLNNNTVLLNALKKEKICFYLSFFIFLLNLLLDIVLIKYYGLVGVAAATGVCYIIYFTLTEIYIRKITKKGCAREIPCALIHDNMQKKNIMEDGNSSQH